MVVGGTVTGRAEAPMVSANLIWHLRYALKMDATPAPVNPSRLVKPSLTMRRIVIWWRHCRRCRRALTRFVLVAIVDR